MGVKAGEQVVGFIKEAVESSRWLMPPPKGTVWDEDEQGFDFRAAGSMV